MRKVLYILGELEDTDLQWLLDAGTARTVAAETVIIREGQAVDDLFIVVGGELSVRLTDVEIARLGSGEVVGEMSLLDSRPPSATVVAREDALVHAIPKRTLRSKLDQDSDFAARFYRALCVFLANRLSRTDTMVGGTAGRVLDDEESSAGDEAEISPDALQNMALAGARFDWFLQRVRGA